MPLLLPRHGRQCFAGLMGNRREIWCGAHVPDESDRQRIDPRQAGEPGEVAIGRHEVTSRFESNRREVGVGYQVSGSPSLEAQFGEDVPMPRTWPHHDGLRHRAKRIDELERIDERRRRLEHTAVSDDTEEAAENDGSQAEGGGTRYGVLDGCSARLMVFGVFAVGVDEDIDVEQLHCREVMTSRRAALLSRSTPGSTPSPLKTGRAGGVECSM